MSVKILLSGTPGCGKTTLIKTILQKIDVPATGFYTEEIRESGTRTGFQIRTLDGVESILSSTKIKSNYKVSKYNVNIEGIENVAVPAIQAKSDNQLIIIDEIGKMECLSDKFRKAVSFVLDSPNPVLATIPQKGTPFIESLKKRNNIQLSALTISNREELKDKLLNILQNLKDKTL